MPVYPDIVKVATATTGTGTITLGAAEAGFRSFSDAAIPNGAEVSYSIDDAPHRETGRGVYDSSTGTLTRSLRSSTTGNLLSLTGNAKVMVTVIGDDLNEAASRSDQFSYFFGG